MTLALGFDTGLAALILALALWVIVAREAFAAVVGFVAFGVLLALAWVRLAAPDVALTEAAIGSVTMKSAPAIEIPASALTQLNRQPAVWIVDPKNHTVSLRNIELARHEPEAVIVGRGLDSGDIVVTAGVQALHPGEQVRLLGASS